MKLNVVILAGGQGSRMQSNVPKSLHKIAGKAMLERVFETASSLLDINKSNIYVVYGDEKLKKELHHLKVKWVLQKEPLGTGHAVLQVAPFIEDDSRTLILYGDVPLITKELLQNLLDETPMASFGLITAVLENPNGFGRIIRDENKKIVSITEQKDLTKEQIKENLNEINTGITLCIPSVSNLQAKLERYFVLWQLLQFRTYFYLSFLFQEDTVTCLVRASVRVSSGASSVIVEPAPIVAFFPILTGATSLVSEPINALSPISVGYLFFPS